MPFRTAVDTVLRDARLAELRRGEHSGYRLALSASGSAPGGLEPSSQDTARERDPNDSRATHLSRPPRQRYLREVAARVRLVAVFQSLNQPGGAKTR